MDARVVRFQRFNPLRRPDWRWEYAHQIVEDDRRVSPQREDEPCIAAVRFLRDLGRCRTDADRAGLRRRWPGIHEAHELAHTDGPLKWEVEARILAGQSDDEIARACSIAAPTVRWFHDLHFQVRDRLDSHGWVLVQLGLDFGYGSAKRNLHQIWKAFGYFAGPIVLDAFIKAFRASLRPGQPPTVDVYFAEHSRAPAEMRAAIAVMCAPLDQTTAMEFTKLNLRLQEIEHMPSPAMAGLATAELQEQSISLYRTGRTSLSLDVTPTTKRRRKRRSSAPTAAQEDPQRVVEVMRSMYSDVGSGNRGSQPPVSPAAGSPVNAIESNQLLSAV